jgi:hypothetical protein
VTIRAPQHARHEVKFRSDPARYGYFAQWTRIHPAGFCSPYPPRPVNLPATVVVEFKFARKDFFLGSRTIQGLPVRASRKSKYVIGVQSPIPG